MAPAFMPTRRGGRAGARRAAFSRALGASMTRGTPLDRVIQA